MQVYKADSQYMYEQNYQYSTDALSLLPTGTLIINAPRTL